MFQRVVMTVLVAFAVAGCAAEQASEKVAVGSGQQAKVTCTVDDDAPSVGSRIQRKNCS